MQLNPYNFKQYLSAPRLHPESLSWLIFWAAFACLALWLQPYFAPSSVAFDLPKVSRVGIGSPPSAFVVCTHSGYIYQNRFFPSEEALLSALKELASRETLLLAAASNTTLAELLPLLEKLEPLGFKEVAFTVRP